MGKAFIWISLRSRYLERIRDKICCKICEGDDAWLLMLPSLNKFSLVLKEIIRNVPEIFTRHFFWLISDGFCPQTLRAKRECAAKLFMKIYVTFTIIHVQPKAKKWDEWSCILSRFYLDFIKISEERSDEAPRNTPKYLIYILVKILKSE